MPTVAYFLGIAVRMFFNDHDPPHFHVRYQGFVARVRIADGTVIDGELVALDSYGRPDFNLLQNFRSAESRIVYYAFDILIHKNRGLTWLGHLQSALGPCRPAYRQFRSGQWRRCCDASAAYPQTRLWKPRTKSALVWRPRMTADYCIVI